MKFGKLPDISQVDFSFPSVNEDTLRLLGGRPAANGFHPYVGCPRWASKDWVGKLYPKGTKQTDFLAHYSRSFNTIELNTTHYRIPTPEQVQKWEAAAAPGFLFCPKIPQVISHYRKLINCQQELTQFVDAIAHFGDKLGCSFLQMHESFGPNQFGNLQQFVQQWPSGFPLAIEFRHPDWFAEHRLLPALIELLQQHQISTVITDVAGRRDVLHTQLTTKTAMLRFVGNALHETDFSRWEDWMQRLALWRANGLEKLYFFAHEPGDVLAADLGSHVICRLNEAFDQGLTTPGIQEAPGGQMALF
ncbi:MAG: DUF72 domain-containing protein [Bacteroidota bacterium]